MAGPRSDSNPRPESPVQPDRTVLRWESPQSHRTTNAETKTEVLPMAERASSHRTRARPKIWTRSTGLSKCHSAMPLSVELQCFISRSAWSARLTQEQLARVQKDAFQRSFSAGALVCLRGAPADHWIGVIEGLVKVDTVSKGGRATTFAGVPAGSWFGEGALLKDEPRPYSVVALRDSEVGFIPCSTFEWLLDNSHSFSRFVINQLNARCGYYVGLV